MKNAYLLATTALGLCMVVGTGTAQAADPIKLSVGGYMEQWIGFADNDSSNNAFDYADFDTQSDTEIHFTGSTKLDNGLSVSVNMELEADHVGGGFDHSWMTISSDTYGSVIVGGQEAFMNDIFNGAPDVGIGLTDGDAGNWVVNPGNFSTGGYGIDNTFGGDVEHRVKYISPSIAGFTVGIDYAPDEADNNAQPDRLAGDDHNYSYGVTYGGEFSGVEVGVAGSVGHRLINGSGSYDLYSGSASLAMSGWTVSGGYTRFKQSIHQNGQTGNVAANAMNGYGYSAGVSYATGPYAVSLGYGYEEFEATPDAAGLEDTQGTWMLSGSYEMGPGVSLLGSVFGTDYEGETPNDNGADDNDGWGVVAGLAVNF